MNRLIVKRLMDDAKLDCHYGNPFDYILDNWEKNKRNGRRGDLLVEAACSTYSEPMLAKTELEDLATTWDVWIIIPHREEEKDTLDDFFRIFSTVSELSAHGMSPDKVNALYITKINEILYNERDLFATNKVIDEMDDYMREYRDEFDQRLDEQLNSLIKEA